MHFILQIRVCYQIRSLHIRMQCGDFLYIVLRCSSCPVPQTVPWDCGVPAASHLYLIPSGRKMVGQITSANNSFAIILILMDYWSFCLWLRYSNLHYHYQKYQLFENDINIQFYILFSEEGVPTSVDFIRCEPSHMVASYNSCNTYIYDIETAKQVIALESNQTSGTFLFSRNITT